MNLFEGNNGPFVRGMQLKTLGRYADAEKAFSEALALEPDSALTLHQMAVCQFQQETKRQAALQTIDRAIALEPAEPDHHAIRAFILCGLNRPKDALAAGNQALEMDPYSTLTFNAIAQAHLQMQHWAEAELAARQALALSADDTLAANQLTQALRFQNKTAENAEHIAGMLARDPDDAFTHANAGWAALHKGNHREAETHFREALRLDPNFDYAREGLLESFRARSPFYRGYLKYCFWMQRMSAGSRWAVIIGLYLAVKMARTLFTGPYRFVGIALGIVYFMLVLWVWVAKGVGNFILLFDQSAKYALRQNEKIEAILVGGGVLGGAALLLIGFAFNAMPVIVLGAGMAIAAFPFSLTLTNESKIGRWLFGAIGVVMLSSTLLVILQDLVAFMPAADAFKIFVGAIVACLASTWLGNIPALRRA